MTSLAPPSGWMTTSRSAASQRSTVCFSGGWSSTGRSSCCSGVRACCRGSVAGIAGKNHDLRLHRAVMLRIPCWVVEVGALLFARCHLRDQLWIQLERHARKAASDGGHASEDRREDKEGRDLCTIELVCRTVEHDEPEGCYTAREAAFSWTTLLVGLILGCLSATSLLISILPTTSCWTPARLGDLNDLSDSEGYHTDHPRAVNHLVTTCGHQEVGQQPQATPPGGSQ
mmetsp:Transcript_44561/g.105612  ORF Transcript_44561/g.105612 Transcript_44561/m.105612 type:complete len:229 (-) Transcript_44561:873-1559(-)